MARIGEIAIGVRFGRLVVVGERTRGGSSRVSVRCDCGTEKIVYVHNLGTHTRSCGCAITGPTRHGMHSTPEYGAWEQLIQRCTNPNHPSWISYGGRGIAVHPSFRKDFMAFYAEVGPRPTGGHSLDRIDVDRGYEPGNLRWATQREQNLNQRRRLVCKREHRIEGENELITPSGRRRCKECIESYERERNAKRRSRSSAGGAR